MTTRLETLETDVALLKHTAVHTADILVDHTGRLDQIQRQLSGVGQRLDSLERRQEAIESRLDRLIALTLEERAASAERFQRLEDRFEKLES